MTSHIPPWMVLTAALVASLAIPFAAMLDGAAVAIILPLLGVIVLSDLSFALLATRVEFLSRRLLLFEPLVCRIAEAAWLVALWHFGAPGWVVALACASCWLYVQTRGRARQLGLRQLGMTTLAERNVRTTTVALAFAAVVVISIAGGAEHKAWIKGVATISATAWLLLSTLGLLQLVVVAAAALKEVPEQRR